MKINAGVTRKSSRQISQRRWETIEFSADNLEIEIDETQVSPADARKAQHLTILAELEERVAEFFSQFEDSKPVQKQVTVTSDAKPEPTVITQPAGPTGSDAPLSQDQMANLVAQLNQEG